LSPSSSRGISLYIYYPLAFCTVSALFLPSISPLPLGSAPLNPGILGIHIVEEGQMVQIQNLRELVEGTYGLGQVQKNVPDDLGTFQLI
jgi:hypothetical protein